jgi:hypothetical protein
LAQFLFNRNANGVREAKSTQAVGLAVKQADSCRARINMADRSPEINHALPPS